MESQQPPPSVLELIDTLIGGDGYGAIFHEWPTGAPGHAKIEIVAHAGACEHCLVPKKVLASVLSRQFPEGVRLDEQDIRYPGESPER